MPYSRRKRNLRRVPAGIPPEDQIRGNGSLGRLLCSEAWNDHPLGPAKSWSADLWAALHAVFDSPYPMWLGWGPERYFFCNDACLAALGRTGELSLGIPAREFWGQAWEQAVPASPGDLRRVRLATGADAEPLDLVLSYSPWRGESGDTDAVVCRVHLDSIRPAGDHLRTLRAVATALAGLRTEADLAPALGSAWPILARDLSVAHVYLCDDERRTAWLACSCGGEAGGVIAPPLLELGSEGFPVGLSPPRLGVAVAVRVDGREVPGFTTRNNDAGPGGHAWMVAWRGRSPRSPAGFLVAGAPPGREDGETVALVELLAVHLGFALGGARGTSLQGGPAWEEVAPMRVRSRRPDEEARRASGPPFEELVRCLPAALYTCEVDGRLSVCNEMAEHLWGRSPEPGVDRWCGSWRLYRPDGALLAREDCPTAVTLRSGRASSGEELIVERPDGTRRHVLAYPQLLHDEEGRVGGAACLLVDITERRGAERAVQEAHQRLEQRMRARTAELEQASARFKALYHQGLFTAFVGLDGKVVDVNRPWLAASGFRAQEVVGRLLWDAPWWQDAPERQSWIKIGFAEAAQGERFHGETSYRTAAGQERWLEVVIMPMRHDTGEVSFVVQTAMDITERRRAQQELRAAEFVRETDARFRRMADAAPVLIWMADATNAGTWFNQQWLDFVGRDLERELGNGWLENVHAEDAERCARQCAEAFQQQQPFKMEFRLRRRDGEYRWVLDHGVPTFGLDGSLSGFIGTCIDITERIQAEVANRRLAAIVESSEDAIVSKDLNGIVTSWNPSAERLFGYTAAEMVGQPITRLAPPERRDEVHTILERIRRGERVAHFETVRVRKDGTRCDVSLSVSPIKDAAGVIVGAAKIAHDISERRRTEAELRHRERLDRAIGESMDYGIWICDAQGRNVYASESFLRLVGMTQQECSDYGWGNMLHPDDAAETLAAWQECVRAGTSWEREHRFRGVDGRWHPILARGMPVRDDDGAILCWAGINLDISRLKRNEEALRQQTRNLEVLNMVGRILATERDLQPVLQTVTEASRELSGATAGAFFEGIAGETDGQPVLLASSGASTEDLDRFALLQRTPAFVLESHRERLLRIDDLERDGRFRAVSELPASLPVRSLLSVPVLSRSGVVHGRLFLGHPDSHAFGPEVENLLLSVVAQAATAIENGELYRGMQLELQEHERAENALRESEERFRTLADNIAAFAWMADRLGWCTWFNKRWFEYTGLEPGASMERGWEQVVHPEHLPRVRDGMAGGLERGATWEDTFPMRGHDGRYRWFLSRAVPIRDEEGRVLRWFGTNTDVTDLREVETALKRARDEALAASRAKDDFLAALSHELRTPLNPVLLLASDAAENPALPETVRSDFEIIRKNVSLEARLIDDLLDLTRISRGKLLLERETHELREILHDAIETVQPEAAEKLINIGEELDTASCTVYADAVRLQQVFWNVLKNAVKFTPLGGRVRVSSRVDPAARTVTVAVADTGLGMTPAELSRIFTAFSQGDHAVSREGHRFGGLGLGLAISRMVVEMHAGSIRAESPGHGAGSTFFIELPLGSGPVLPPGPAPGSPRLEQPDQAAVLGRRVLLVEDHLPTRAALERLLLRRKYGVRTAGSLQEALAIAATERIDLLISDVGLPDGSGFELIEACPALRGVPAIALTGYGMEQDVTRSRAAGFAAHLIKPISISALDRAIADVLLRSGPAA